MSDCTNLIETNLLIVLAEVSEQPKVGKEFPSELQTFEKQVEQIRKWIEDVGEYGIAYESLISTLEAYPFQLSSRAAIKLLEVGLLMRFKTEQLADAKFDSR